MTLPEDPPGSRPGPSVRARLTQLWRTYRRPFWILHSVWALLTGALVIFLSRERYGFVPWVVGFLALTWASTLFFTRPAGGPDGGGIGRDLTSYVTRVLYQETLFFLLPFYAYSTVFPSWNVLFVALLGCLAILACLDLIFDRWLRDYPSFGLIFFASVAFAALNLLLPLMVGLRPRLAAGIAAVAAVGTAAPLALRGRNSSLWTRLRLGGAALAILALAFVADGLVPPVPLRLQRLTFGTGFDQEDLSLRGTLGSPVEAGSVGGQLVALAEVFAPSNVPARIVLEWRRDGEVLRTSREVEILAHRSGFRVWDVYRPEGAGLSAGVYRIVLKTVDGRLFGAAELVLD